MLVVQQAMKQTVKTSRVLVIDDDAVVRRSLKTFLEGRGYRVMEKSHGAGVVKLIEMIRIDAIILDILMDVQEGLQTLQEIRSQFPYLKVIMISSDSMYLAISQELGASHIMKKPLDFDQLQAYLPPALLVRDLPDA